jgi:hypothetical protein
MEKKIANKICNHPECAGAFESDSGRQTVHCPRGLSAPTECPDCEYHIERWCKVRQINKYEVTCPYCNKSWVCDEDGDDYQIDVDLQIKCVHCGEVSTIPDF